MSSLEKLELLGIRSFGTDHYDRAVIKFSSPLTLILGQNGCGKTTIIEALKYATCGELPAGTDGGSGFIHDPKLTNQIDSYGNVKLRCRNIKGQKLHINRAAKVTQKARKLEFKTHDATVTNSENKSISGRCADIDTYVCSELGVSKAVLTNVLFCHQEDSNWPLEKGKKMKEKFDAIFGVTEYNKCIDHLKSLSKQMDVDKTIKTKEVDCHKTIWEEANKKRKELDESKIKLSAIRDTITSCDNEIRPIEAKYRELLKKEEDLGKHVAKVNEKKNWKQLLLKSERELKARIKTEFQGSKEELNRKIRNFEMELQEKKIEFKDLGEQKAVLINEEKSLQNEINLKQMKRGTLQSEEDTNYRITEGRNVDLNNLAQELQLPIMSSSQLNESNGDELLRAIQRKIKERTGEIEKLQDQNDTMEKSLQAKIDSLREKKVSFEHDIKSKKQNIQDNKKEKGKVEEEIEQVDKSAEILGKLEAKLSKLNKELEETAKQLNVEELKSKIEDNSENSKRLEEQLSTVDNEIKTLQKLSLEKSNLDKLIERKNKTEDELKSKKLKNSSALKHLLSEVPDKDFAKKLETRVSAITSQIKNLENSIGQKEKQVSVLKEKKKLSEEQLRTKQRKLSKDDDDINELIGKEDYDGVVSKLKTQIQEAQDLKGTFSSSEYMFRRYIDKLKCDKSCPVCHRDFDNQDEVTELIQDLDKRLKELPRRLKEAVSSIDSLNERHSRVLQIKPLYDNVTDLREKEIPQLKKSIEETNTNIVKIEKELEDERNSLMEPQTDQGMANGLVKDAMRMDQLQKELSDLLEEIAAQKKKIPDTGINKTLQQANDEQDKLKAEIKSLGKFLEDDRNRLISHNEKLSKLREEKNNITSQQMKIEGGVQQRKALADRMEELEAISVTLSLELSDAEKQLVPVASQLNTAISELSRAKSDHKRLIDEKKKKVNEFNNKVQNIRAVQADIDEYEKKGGAARLQTVKKELSELERKKESNQNQRTRLEKSIDSINQFCTKQELEKADLENNRELLEKTEEIRATEEDIKQLEGQLGNLTADNLSEQKNKFSKQLNDLQRRKDQSEGRQTEMQTKIREIENTLNRDPYRMIEEKYNSSYISLQIQKLAIQDVKLYAEAMDHAMILFHRERMRMINTIIRDFWRHTYQGNDIDTIEIKMDEATTTATGRRSYNYRVVQVKNGMELDMPGRCSAGQKVLASLLIRMALAETFSKNCGILALDEPTTNLDRDNIDSLSDTLTEIVNRRYTQKNFQLLVITHDEEFMRKLARVDKVDRYLLVQRNDRGKSIVKSMEVC